ncbi:hypothetical protein CKO19_12200 [Rhodovulum adriaticum]|nr:hypothetical protein [Rhodovulum adriaticum]
MSHRRRSKNEESPDERRDHPGFGPDGIGDPLPIGLFDEEVDVMGPNNTIGVMPRTSRAVGISLPGRASTKGIRAMVCPFQQRGAAASATAPRDRLGGGRWFRERTRVLGREEAGAGRPVNAPARLVGAQGRPEATIQQGIVFRLYFRKHARQWQAIVCQNGR